MTIWISMMIFNVVEERENKYIIILYQYIYLFYLQYCCLGMCVPAVTAAYVGGEDDMTWRREI